MPGMSSQSWFLAMFFHFPLRIGKVTPAILQRAQLRGEEALLVNCRRQVSLSALHTNLHKTLPRVIRRGG